MNSNILIDGDPSHTRWIEIALEYLPEEMLKKEGENLAVIAVGCIGGCRLPQQYRQREIVLLSDWIFPPAGHSEGDEAGKFLILTLLHEIAHAVQKHRSPSLDSLTPDEVKTQENEADNLAIKWFNGHVKDINNKFLKTIQAKEFREIVNRYATLCEDIEKFKFTWHKNVNT